MRLFQVNTKITSCLLAIVLLITLCRFVSFAQTVDEPIEKKQRLAIELQRTLAMVDDCWLDRQAEYQGSNEYVWKPGAWHLGPESSLWAKLDIGRSVKANLWLRFQPVSDENPQVVTEFHIPCSAREALAIRLRATKGEQGTESFVEILRLDVSQEPPLESQLRAGRMKGYLPDGQWGIDYHFGLVTISHRGNTLLSGYLRRAQPVAGVIVRQRVGGLVVERIEIFAEPREAAQLPADQLGKIQEAADNLEKAGELQLQSDYPRATSLAEKSLARFVEILGERHPWSLDARALSGFCEFRLPGRVSEGRKKLQSALTVGREVFGEQHPMVAEFWIKLAGQRLEVGDNPGAQRAYQAALQIFEAVFNDDSEEYATTAFQAGHAASNAGDMELAGKYFEQGLKAARNVWPNGDFIVATAIQRLALHYVHSNRNDEARKLFAEGLRMAEEAGSIKDRILARLDLAELDDRSIQRSRTAVGHPAWPTAHALASFSCRQRQLPRV